MLNDLIFNEMKIRGSRFELIKIGSRDHGPHMWCYLAAPVIPIPLSGASKNKLTAGSSHIQPSSLVHPIDPVMATSFLTSSQWFYHILHLKKSVKDISSLFWPLGILVLLTFMTHSFTRTQQGQKQNDGRTVYRTVQIKGGWWKKKIIVGSFLG